MAMATTNSRLSTLLFQIRRISITTRDAGARVVDQAKRKLKTKRRKRQEKQESTAAEVGGVFVSFSVDRVPTQDDEDEEDPEFEYEYDCVASNINNNIKKKYVDDDDVMSMTTTTVMEEGVDFLEVSLSAGTTTSSRTSCRKLLVWKTTDSSEYWGTSMPLIVTDPEQPDQVILDPRAELGRRLADVKRRRLPTTTMHDHDGGCDRHVGALGRNAVVVVSNRCFGSNHVMVNEERTKRCIAPLTRLVELDALARQHAEQMAAEGRVFHSQLDQLQAQFSRPARRLGENVAAGVSIRDMHEHMMLTVADRNNLLDRRYTHMGMGTARAKRKQSQQSKGRRNNSYNDDNDDEDEPQLYMCQIYRG